MSQIKIITHTVLRSAYNDFDSPCCGSTACKSEHREQGGEIYQCYGCGNYFAVVENQTGNQVVRIGQVVVFKVQDLNHGGEPLKLLVERHPFDC